MTNLTNLLAILQATQHPEQRAYAGKPHPRPSLDLQKYVLKRGRYHLRPEYLTAAIEALELRGNPDAPAALQQVIQHQLTPSLRVAVYAPSKLTGAFRTAEEGQTSTWESRAGNYAPILDSRAVLADRYGLVKGRRAPVSGTVLLHDPPGALGHLFAHLDGAGLDGVQEYGHHVHLLKSGVLDRALLFHGDSQEEHERAEYAARQAVERGDIKKGWQSAHAAATLAKSLLTPAEATLLAALPNTIDRGDRKPYLEALILGGLHADVDVLRHIPTRRDSRGFYKTERGHIDRPEYLRERVMEHLARQRGCPN